MGSTVVLGRGADVLGIPAGAGMLFVSRRSFLALFLPNLLSLLPSTTPSSNIHGIYSLPFTWIISSLKLAPGMALKDLNHPGIRVEIPGTAPSVPSRPAVPSRYSWHCPDVLWNRTDPVFCRMVFPNRSSPACSKKGNGHPREKQESKRSQVWGWQLGSGLEYSHQDK